MSDIIQIKQLLSLCAPAQREEIFRHLRAEFVIHPLEVALNTEAEIILEAIQRAGGLTLRMMRGVIAEAAFQIHVAEHLSGWDNVTPSEDLPYDFLLRDGQGTVRVQVKLQRSVGHRPMWASQAYRFLPENRYVVETQRPRGGSHRKTGGSTRPYHCGDFDLLAVAMYPSTNTWATFMYTVSDWLLSGQTTPSEMLKFQPVAIVPDDDWTDDFYSAVTWWRSGVKKKIRGGR